VFALAPDVHEHMAAAIGARELGPVDEHDGAHDPQRLGVDPCNGFMDNSVVGGSDSYSPS
jgi:hypothetical protein